MADATDDTEAESKTSSFDVSSVTCSICLDLITDGDRSRATLQCGHEFHLDCIGSAFNMKGAMQCPNCRKVERGRWLYASGSTRSFPDMSTDDWTLHEDQYGLTYPEIPFNIHWCPFSGLARVHSAFEAMESSPPTGYNLHRHHTMFAEHGTASSMAHSYVAYFRPIPPVTSSNASENVEDPNFNYHWNGIHNEIFSPHAFPVTDIHYQNGGHHSHPFSTNSSHGNSTDQASVPPVTLRSSRGDFGAITRSGSFMHPFLHGHGSRSHERQPPSHAIHHPHPSNNPLGMPSAIIPNIARFHGRRALPLPMPANSLSDRNGGFFIFPPQGSSSQNTHETENPLPVISSDRDSGWSSFSHGGVSDSSRTGSFWHRHWS